MKQAVRYLVLVLALALVGLSGGLLAAEEQEKSTKEKIDKAVQDVSHPIQKVMKPIEQAISEGASKVASTVKKAFTSEKPDKK